jgi:hypothetical protein
MKMLADGPGIDKVLSGWLKIHSLGPQSECTHNESLGIIEIGHNHSAVTRGQKTTHRRRSFFCPLKRDFGNELFFSLVPISSILVTP